MSEERPPGDDEPVLELLSPESTEEALEEEDIPGLDTDGGLDPFATAFSSVHQLVQGVGHDPIELMREQETDENRDAIALEFGGPDSNVISLLPRMAPDAAPWEVLAEERIQEDTEDEDTDTLAPPEPEMLEGTVEAMLLTASKPLTEAQLNTHLAGPGLPAIRECLYRIQDRFRRPGSGIRLVEVAKGWQFRTDMRCAPYVAAMRGEQPVKLSKAALETLAIVAYRQPVTRAEVEDLRGVDPGGILRMLVERRLVCVTGRKDAPGRPLLYGTTTDFLGLFGLRDLSDLPTLRDLRELQRDDAREGIGSTDVDIESALIDAVLPDEDAASEEIDVPVQLHPVQEPLPLEPIDPID